VVAGGAPLYQASQTPTQQWDLDFTLENQMDQDINQLFTKRSDTSKWLPFPDYLQPHRSNREITFGWKGYDLASCTYDIRMKYSGEMTSKFSKIDLCHADNVVIYVMNGKILQTIRVNH
jgi:hypothetical protein